MKPRKPRPSFPLSAHDNGQWYTTRRINGRKQFFYFGRWDTDPRGEAAEAAYLAVATDLNARRFPPAVGIIAGADGVTAGEVVERFMDAAELRYRAGEIGAREFDDVRRACLFYFLDAVPADTPAAALGALQPGQSVRWLDAFRSHLSGRVGVYRFNNSVAKVRRMLRWAHLTAKVLPVALHDDEALRRKPAKLVKRARRLGEAENGKPIFSPRECRQIVSAAAKQDGPLLAFVLLALNAGMGQSHIADLPADPGVVDLAAGRVDWVRTKSEELFQFTLWPVTAIAIEQYTRRRPDPRPDAEGLLFVTRCGRPWVRESVGQGDDGTVGPVSPHDEIGKAFDKLQRSLGMKRPGRGFYALRRTFATAANDLQDADATHRVMGHALRGMDAHYVREVPWARIQAVTAYVGQKLLGRSAAAPELTAAGQLLLGRDAA